MNDQPTALTYQYFTVEPQPKKPGRKTRVWEVYNRSGPLIGRIEWYSAWRQYILSPEPDTVWSVGCMRDIEDALKKIREMDR